METRISAQYKRWLQRADASLQEALGALGADSAALEDAFYRNLAFGTGGLRGVLGPGTNRMNLHTVAKASQGLANYLCRHFPAERRSVAVSYDSRILSDAFARTTACVLAAAGVQVWLYPELMPTPCLSFAVRALHCAAGIMVTASHNPAKYNGYKVYNEDGCQITLKMADDILKEIEALDIFDDVHLADFDHALTLGYIRYIPESIAADYIGAVKAQSLLDSSGIQRNFPIVYSPLNGTGLKPVLRTLTACGFTNVSVVEEQRLPDGRFPTCPYPNPEVPEAMSLAIAQAKRLGAALVLATDPDSDRIGVAARSGAGEYVLFTGNEIGLLLLDYICARLAEQGRMPAHPVFIKTIVTSPLAERIAQYYGVETVNVLTGFKFIGEQIGALERSGRADDYIFGFEESCGYLRGSYVRDKDAVVAAMLVSEMFAWYRSRGITLPDALDKLYQAHGYCLNTLLSYEFDGAAGAARISRLMAEFRGIAQLGGRAVENTLDYAPGVDGLPPADVVRLTLTGGSTVIVRPSGTEPKIKFYLTTMGKDASAAAAERDALRAALEYTLSE